MANGNRTFHIHAKHMQTYKNTVPTKQQQKMENKNMWNWVNNCFAVVCAAMHRARTHTCRERKKKKRSPNVIGSAKMSSCVCVWVHIFQSDTTRFIGYRIRPFRKVRPLCASPLSLISTATRPLNLLTKCAWKPLINNYKMWTVRSAPPFALTNYNNSLLRCG